MFLNKYFWKLSTILLKVHDNEWFLFEVRKRSLKFLTIFFLKNSVTKVKKIF